MPCIKLSSGKTVCFEDKQFALGGETDPPINNRINYRINNIPTTQDSTNLYNAQTALNKFYDDEVKAGRLKKAWVEPYYYPNKSSQIMKQENLKFYNDQLANRARKGFGDSDFEYKKTFNLTPDEIKKLEQEGLQMSNAGNNNQYYYRDLVTPLQNLVSPFAMVDSRIAPQRSITYMPTPGNANTYPGGLVKVYDYDPLRIKPHVLRTPEENVEWEKKYGKSKSKPNTQPQSKPNQNVRERLELEPIPTKQVLPLTSNITMEPRSIDLPSTPQSSDEESNRNYSVRIPTIDVNKRQVAPRVNRVLGKNVVNPKPNYKRSIEFGSKEIPITDDYHLNKALMKIGMEPKFNEGGKTNNMKNGINNPGFKSLPGSVQQKIVANMEMGGLAIPTEGDKIVKNNAPAAPKQLTSQQLASLATSQFSKDPSMQTPLPNFIGSYQLTDMDKTLMMEAMKQMKGGQGSTGVYPAITPQMIDQIRPKVEQNRTMDQPMEREMGGMNTMPVPEMSITDPDYEQMMLQYGGMVQDLDGGQVIQKFGKGGGIIYRGQKFPGYNKPIKTPPGDKYKKMVLVKKGDKVRLVKMGYNTKK